jgi:hypothetical protein
MCEYVKALRTWGLSEKEVVELDKALAVLSRYGLTAVVDAEKEPADGSSSEGITLAS